uniref:YkgJ family cysteine cluster protein n=1 Tax=Geobacter metallireducens TaxID=28232 RepID=A0A831XFP0_GEOME
MPGSQLRILSPSPGDHAIVAREIERLKRRIIWAERAGEDQGRRIAFVYRVADRFGRRVFPHTFCRTDAAAAGCITGSCCRCRPDVFAREKGVLDLLPQQRDNDGFCPFFNRARRNCGIYAMRPLACRIYYNIAASRLSCRNPADAMLALLASLRPHLEKILGPYQGGYGGYGR